MAVKLLFQMKFWYPMVMLSLGLCHQMVAQWLVYFYAPPAATGAPAFLDVGMASAVMVFGRVIDAVSDPVVAYFSDGSRLKMGRRKPFLLGGTFLLAASFALIWHPPVESVSLINFLWAAVMLGLFFLSYSIIAVPYLALLPEITFTEEQRITLATSQMVFYGAGAGLGFLLSTVLGPLLGLPLLAVTLLPFALFALLWPTFQIKEKPLRQQLEKKSGFSGWLATLSSLKNNKIFLLWIIIQAFTWATFIMIAMLIPYIGSVLLDISSPAKVSVQAVLLLILGSSLGVTMAFYYVKKKGKDVFYGYALLFSGLIIAMFSLVGLEAIPGTAQIQAAVLLALAAGPLAIIMVLPNAVVAEISEIRLQTTGEHREALLYAGQGLVVKLSMALGSALFGVILFTIEQIADYEAGIRLICVVAGLLILIAAGIYRFFLKEKSSKNAMNT